MIWGVRLFLLALMAAAPSLGDDWEDPPFSDPENEFVNFTRYEIGSDKGTFIQMNEELPPPITIAKLNYNGETAPQITKFDMGNNELLGAVIENNPDEGWVLVVTNQVDYELLNIQGRFTFTVSSLHNVIVQINNIDDNPPDIIPLTSSCEIEENSHGPLECYYKISDADGWLQEMKWTVDGARNEANMFNFEYIDSNSIGNTTKEAETQLMLINDFMLDYEEYSAHVMTWYVTDSGNNEASQSVIVNVIDMPDTAPRWTQIFAVEQFDEKTEQEFTVTAIDGDVSINDDILYYITSDHDDLFSIDELTGVIKVNKIDRDALQQEIFTVTLNAIEKSEPKMSTPQSVTFIVNDVNDNSPTIIEPSSKTLTLTIPEARISDIQEAIVINDVDSSENAIYTVTLLDESSFSYNSAFQIVPSQGYQRYSFSMSIVDSSLLDYEDEHWRTFSFTLLVQETVDPTHTDVLTINVQLINWNDESPIFEEDVYTPSIREDVPKNTPVVKVVATDRDEGDSVVYNLVGSSANRILKIDEETGEITTSVDNAFDYERQTEVTVQVTATDKFEDEYETSPHITYAQVTITIEDVNDETPRITVASTATIAENQEDQTEILVDITATDEDATADLSFNINWDLSYATKSGRTLDLSQTLEDYIYSVKVETVSIDESSMGYVRATMRISETVVGKTPDYEAFDTLYLSLTVTDLNQEINSDSDTVTVTIFIEDKNDNAPEFTDDSVSANNTVTEAAEVGSTIGTIVATDADGLDFNVVTYSLTAIDDTPEDLITIDPSSGLLSVTRNAISADTPEKRWYLHYEVTASDGELSTTAEISIFIIDINNNDPKFETFESTITIKEKSPSETLVVQLIATDDDRDEPNNVVWYAFTATTTDSTREFFSIDTDSGELKVNYRSDEIQLDRDEGISTFNIGFRAGDNRYGSYQRYSEEQTLTIILEDINDQTPIIETKTITISEELTEGSIIPDQVIATDKDDPTTDNAKIEFTVVSLLDSEGNEVEQLFEINSQEATGVASLRTSKDLKNYYGQYTLIIRTNDLGFNPETNEHNYLDNEIEIVIEKHNFQEPVFVYPTDELRVFLSKTQQLNTYLYLYNGDRLAFIQADDQQGGKWDIQFTIDEEQSTGGSIFTINNSEEFGQSTGRLQLTQLPENWEGLYKLHIVANDNGNPPLSSSVNLNIRFYDPDSLPYFAENERLLEIQFTENETGLSESKEIYTASYNYGGDEEDWNFQVYYLLLEGDSEVFAVDLTTGAITLKQTLDREEQDQYQLRIIASNSETMPANYDEQSVLVVELKVLDVNDNPPNFSRSYYSNGISTLTALQTTIITLSANDIDEAETLTFTIVDGSLEAIGSQISELSAPFVIDENSGTIVLNFKVQANMMGYFVFSVVVTDSPPESHTDTATVQVFIITDDNRIELTFENPLGTVIALQDTVQEILESFFSYTCNIESILSATDENGQTIDTQTVVTVHFVDQEQNVPVNKTEIQNKLSDIEFFTDLRATFINSTLYLLSYTSSTIPPENLEEQLRTWLIAVSVTLGALCILLVMAFVLRTRSLTQRLNNLSTVKAGSQESGLNRIGLALPNTNKNALECSNPLYNEEKKMPDFDQHSIHSGDSDLIGVEDNPEFDYTPSSNGFVGGEKARY